ncbi:hypothetical protein J5I95_19470 [Candidatus Poribacteria bacterium]|nr:hypothetical protein [Candidatus Poribacteria bacterium]
MLKFLSSKSLIACLVFFLFSLGGSLFYHYHSTHSYNEQLAKTDAFLQRLNERNATRPTRTVEAQMPTSIEGTTLTTDAIEETFEVTDMKSAEEDVVDVEDVPSSDETLQFEPVSAEAPLSSSNFIPQTKEELTKEELKTLVEQKLREQGIPVMSSFMENGLVYPLTRDTIYVQWDEYVDRGRVFRYIARSIALSDTSERLGDIQRSKGRYFTEDDLPSDLTLIPFGEGGIAPYTFLGLERNVYPNP